MIMKKIYYLIVFLGLYSCTPKYKELFDLKYKEHEALKKKYESLHYEYITIKDEKEYLRDQCRVFYMEKENLNFKIDSLKKVISRK